MFKRILLVSLISGLITSNILTLLDNEFHQTAFDLLTKSLGYVVTQENLARISSNSPTQRYAAIEANNKKLIAEYSTLKASNLKHLDILNSVLNSIYQHLGNRLIQKSISKTIPILNIVQSGIEIKEDCQTFDELNELRSNLNVEILDKPVICEIVNTPIALPEPIIPIPDDLIEKTIDLINNLTL